MLQDILRTSRLKKLQRFWKAGGNHKILVTSRPRKIKRAEIDQNSTEVKAALGGDLVTAKQVQLVNGKGHVRIQLELMPRLM